MKKESNTGTTKALQLEWKVHTARLLEEILVNPSCVILKVPLNIFGKLLYEVADRASQINDPELNALMARLTLYEVADPYNKDYDSEVVNQLIKEAEVIRKASGQ